MVLNIFSILTFDKTIHTEVKIHLYQELLYLPCMSAFPDSSYYIPMTSIPFICDALAQMTVRLTDKLTLLCTELMEAPREF